jgi:hypothetical protein
MWRYGGDSLAVKTHFTREHSLSKQGINKTLVTRMLVNYYILRSEEQMQVFDYGEQGFVRHI